MNYETLKEQMIKTGIELLQYIGEDTELFDMIGELLYELDFGSSL